MCEELTHIFPPLHLSRRFTNQVDHRVKADCCKSGDGGRHTDRHTGRHIEMKDDDDAEGFDGVRGGSGIRLIDFVDSEVDESICQSAL